MPVDLSQYKSNSKSGSLTSVLDRKIEFRKHGISIKSKIDLYTQLNILLKSGLELSTALELISEQNNTKKNKNWIEDLSMRIHQGKSLSEAMEDSGQFGAYEIQSMRIGEESSSMMQVTKDICEYFKRKQELRSQLIGVFAYPAFVLLVSLGVVFFMLNYVVPLFEDVFGRFGGELPLLTRIVIEASELAQHIFLPLLFTTAVGLILLVYVRNTVGFKRITSELVLRLPFIGDTYHKLQLARFCQSMAMLLRSRIPLVRSLQLTSEMVGFYPLHIASEKLRVDLEGGEFLNKAMNEHKIFPKRMSILVKVAEEVNQLDTMFNNLYSEYSEEVENRTKTLGKLLEPVMIIVIGVVVGTILIAMYLPLFEMSKIIG